MYKYLVQKSSTPLKVEWLKNDKAITIDTAKYETTQNDEENSYSLAIKSCNIKDAGKYSISVANSFGKINSDFRLLVKCNYF